MRLVAGALLLLSFATAVAQAQRPDTAAARRAARADSLRPPLSPRRAFLYSLVVPGSAQSILGRNKAAALFFLFEGISLSMIRESNADIQEARRSANDSVVVAWTPSTPPGGPPTPVKIAPRFDDDYVRARRSHLEDWIFVTVANHLFAGADAFVAAHLWDVRTQVSLRSTPQGTLVGASLSF